jgi:hypothetical protein
MQRVLGPIALNLVVSHFFICPVNEPDSNQTQSAVCQEEGNQKLISGAVVVSKLPLEELNLVGLVFADALHLRGRVWLEHRVGESQPKAQTHNVDEKGKDQEVRKIADPQVKVTLQKSVLDSSFEVFDCEDPIVKEVNAVQTLERVKVLEISARVDNQIKFCAGVSVNNDA